MLLSRNVEHVLEAVDVHIPREVRIALGRGRQDRCEVEDRVDVVAVGDVRERVGVQDAYELVGTGLEEIGIRLGVDVGGQDILGAVPAAQRQREFGTDLSGGAGHQDSAYRFLRQGVWLSERLRKSTVVMDWCAI